MLIVRVSKKLFTLFYLKKGRSIDMTLFKYTIKKVINYMIIFFLIVLMLLIGSNNTLSVYADSIDITTTSVRDDLKSMNEDKLSYLSDEEFIFIGMSQYYDKDDNLRTYLYANIPYDISTFDYNWYATISTSVMDENYNITEDFKLYPIEYVNNGQTEKGEYEVTVIFTNPNYETVEKTVTLTIKGGSIVLPIIIGSVALVAIGATSFIIIKKKKK